MYRIYFHNFLLTFILTFFFDFFQQNKKTIEIIVYQINFYPNAINLFYKNIE